jgi:hypothetical protein
MVARAAVVLLHLVFLEAVTTRTPLWCQEKSVTVIVKGNLTTGSQLFPYPDSPDETDRAQYLPFEDVPGYGLELRYSMHEMNIAVGLSADFIRASELRRLAVSSLVSVPVEDGYRVIPLEVTAYFIIPVSGSVVGVYMGGGGGAYFGRRIYRFAGIEAPPVSQEPGFGIHVLGGMSYRFGERVSLNAEMKFRDLQFESSNAFPVSRILYNGVAIPVSRDPFVSRVHTNGVLFQIGAAFGF